MISRTTHRRLRFAVIGVLLGMLATVGFGAAAAAAPPASPSASAKPSSNAVVSITGPTIKHTLTFRQDKQPTQYRALLAEVSWMNGRTSDIIKSPQLNLGPHFVVTTAIGSKVTGRYDLYPEVPGGPRAHRQALGSQKDGWFYAPVDMASTLAGLGVGMPTTAPSQQIFIKPTVAPTSLQHSLSAIARESVTALVLAALGCVAILILLAFAARRSHSVDRRRTLPPALGRLASAKAKAATGRGAVLRNSTPPRGARMPAGPQRGPARAAAAVPAGSAQRPANAAARAGGPRAGGLNTPPGGRAAVGVPGRPRAPRQVNPAAGSGLTPQASEAAAKRAATAKLSAPRRASWRGLLSLPRPRKTPAPPAQTPAGPAQSLAGPAQSPAAAAQAPVTQAPVTGAPVALSQSASNEPTAGRATAPVAAAATPASAPSALESAPSAPATSTSTTSAPAPGATASSPD